MFNVTYIFLKQIQNSYQFLSKFNQKGICLNRNRIVLIKLSLLIHESKEFLFFSLPGRSVQVTHATTDAVNQLRVKMVALVVKCVTSELEDSSAHAHLAIPATNVRKRRGHVTTSCYLGVTQMEFTKYVMRQTKL